MTACRFAAAAALVALGCGARVSAQDAVAPRVSAETVASVSMLSSYTHPSAMFDATATLNLGGGLIAIARPWAWHRPDGTWTAQWYQLQLRYQSRARIPVRIDAGIITSPLGLNTLQQRADLNPTISPTFYYVVQLPRIDVPFDGLQMLSAGYPLGAIVSASGARWDVRGGITDSTPARPRAELKKGQRAAAPQLIVGGGFTPHAGVRVGVGLAHGRYRDGVGTVPEASATVFNLEAEYAINHTRLSGEWVRNRFGTSLGPTTARAYYLQAVQTITPRIFGAGRIARVNTPPLFPPLIPATIDWTTAELTAGFRVTREWTVRGGLYRQRPYRSKTWDNQGAVSLVWARRWY
jgi:hypothetical protein